MCVLNCITQTNSSWNSQYPEADTSLAPYRIFDIGNSSPVKLMDFIHAIEEACGKLSKEDIFTDAIRRCISDKC